MNLEHATLVEKLLGVSNEVDWEGLRSYVNQHCMGVKFEDAKKWATKGLQIIRDLRLENPVTQSDLEKKLVYVCWGLVAHAITKRQEFAEGTIHYRDPGLRLFNFFAPIYYGRRATHYQKRAQVPFSEGKLKGYAHFGYDPDLPLPAGKGAVLIGAIDGDNQPIYIKMEDAGANLNPFDPRALKKLHHVILHTIGFFKSQAKRNLPSIFGDVGEGARKEHMLPEDKKEIEDLFILCRLTLNKHAFSEKGFSYAIPELLKAFNDDTTLSSTTKERVGKYIELLERRYDYLTHRKGNEIQIGESIEAYKNSLIDSNSFLDSNVENENWKVAFDQLLKGSFLTDGALKAYLSYLEKTTNCDFKDLLISDTNLEHVSAESITHLVKNSEKSLVFIPLVLESAVPSWIPLLNTYLGTDQHCLLVYDRDNQTLEYYNPYGISFKNENRIIRGTNLTAKDLVEVLGKGLRITDHTTPHLNDSINSGVRVLEFAKKRTQSNFEGICKQEIPDISQVRTQLAKDLRYHYDPNPINQVACPEEVKARLKKQCGTVIGKTAQTVLEENGRVYFNKDQKKFDRDAIFKQVEKDLCRNHEGMRCFEIDRTPYKRNDAQGVLTILKEYTKQDEQEALKILSVLQQGAFSPVQMQISIDLDLFGMESNFQVRGESPSLEEWLKKKKLPLRHYRVDTKKEIIKCEAYYELYASSEELNNNASVGKPYAVLKACVHIDLKNDQASESWNVEHIIE